MHISLCSGLIFRRNCRKSEGQQSAGQSRIVYIYKGNSLHMCMCVCVCVCLCMCACPCACKHLCLHFWHCAGICNCHVWYGCCVNRVCYIWPSVIPTQHHPPTIHTHFTLGFTLISPSTHVHPLQVRWPADGDCLPLKLAQNNMWLQTT